MSNRDEDPKLTRRQTDNVRARLAAKADMIVDALVAHGMGELDMSPSRVKALQVVLDRVLPSMQSIDQTTHSDQPELSPDELDTMLTQAVRDMARKDPEKLRAMLDQPKLTVVA